MKANCRLVMGRGELKVGGDEVQEEELAGTHGHIGGGSYPIGLWEWW